MKNFVILIALILSTNLFPQNIIKVEEQYPTIQASVNTAGNGANVLITPDIYNEYKSVSNKIIIDPSIDSLILNAISETNIDTLKHYVRVLSGEDSVIINNTHYLIDSRYSFHPHNDLAADFIYQTLLNTGLPTFNQSCSESGRNVYSVQKGTVYPDKKFIICAHYDDMPSEGPAPGADDNASGTAAVLEAARIISKIATPYTIIYALWDEEEISYCGSGYFAQQEYYSGQDIRGVINVDVIGWDSNNDGIFEIHTQPIANSEELAGQLANLANYYNLDLLPIIQNPGTSYSDHQNFWARGYSAVLFIERLYGGDYNSHVHTSEDRIAHFNLNYFYSMSKLAVGSIAFFGLNDLVVPVELISFTAVSKENGVELNWVTVTETNNSGFSIERKIKNENYWKSIGFIEGKGTTTDIMNYSYTDKNLETGIYNYRLKQIDFNNGFENSKTVEVEVNIPKKFVLEQNHPNPFNPTTRINYTIPTRINAKIKVFNSLGREVAELISGEIDSGSYGIEFNAANLPSGVYFYRLQTENFIDTKKMILLK